MAMTYNPTASGEEAREAFVNIQAATEVGELLGHTVMWYMDGLHADHTQLEATMKQADIDLGDFVPKVPSPRVALHRALEAMLRDQTGARAPARGEDDELDGDATRTLIRPMNDRGKEWMVFALVNEAADFATVSLSYETQWRVKFHKKTGMLVCVETASGEIKDEQDNPRLSALLQPYWDTFRQLHTSRDLSLVVKSVIDWASAISLRRQGGVYFVPIERQDVLVRVQLLLDRLVAIYGGEPVFLTLGVPDEGATRREMSKAAHLAIVLEAEEIIEALGKVIGSEAKTRRGTVMDRIAAWHLFRNKIEAYDFILANRKEQMAEQLAQMDALAIQLMTMDGALEEED